MEKGVAEGELVGQHCRFNGHEFEQLQESGGQRHWVRLQSLEPQRVAHDCVTEPPPRDGG